MHIQIPQLNVCKRQRKLRRMLYSTISVLALSGCALFPPKLDVTSLKSIDRYETSQSFAAPVTAWPSDNWWADYSDPQLSKLISEALASAPDMRSAQARLEQANAQAQLAGASLLPSVNADAVIQDSKLSYNNGVPSALVPHGWKGFGVVGLDFSWTIDFWGKNRAAVAAATSDAKAADAEAASARLTLSTAVATAYADLAGFYTTRDAAEDAIRVRSKTAALMRKRYENALENKSAAQRAESAQASTEAQLAQIDESIELTRNRIASLMGAGPDRGRAIARPAMPKIKQFGLPENLPAELLGRRPEIIAAKLRADAASQKINEAEASFYPNVNLMAFIGQESIGLNMLRDSSSRTGSVGPAISLPIFDGSRLRASYFGAEADFNLAVASYDSAVTQALYDVANAAASKRALSHEMTKTLQAEVAARRAWEVTSDRYKGGLATYLEVLTAEDALIKARYDVATLKTRAFVLDVSLIHALGGGFHTNTANNKENSHE